jgi:hypothetical protein
VATRRDELYAVLGLTRHATPGEVARAYRRLAKRYHPDIAGPDPVAAERFAAVNHAYQTLAASTSPPKAEQPVVPRKPSATVPITIHQTPAGSTPPIVAGPTRVTPSHDGRRHP